MANRKKRDTAQPAADAEPARELRIEELARESGTSARNIRAYQDRGLLPPPRREGRVALYTDVHVNRLRLIASLLARGYSLANVGELIAAWERGQNVAELLGLEAALAAPWTDEVPTTMSLPALLSMFRNALSPRALIEANRMGVVEPEGLHFKVNSPTLLRVGAELVDVGVPLEAVLEIGLWLDEHLDVVAERFIGLFEEHVLAPLGDPIPPENVPQLAEMIQRLRPLAQAVVDAQLARAMERHVGAVVGERVGRLLEQERDATAS